ncbi:MAG: DoxX family membrane protein [Candidatus Eremiobacteraeota bacterium]|nr:DoxX family membrane protein [Candidatus Eremiobacteraeota bacterium]
MCCRASVILLALFFIAAGSNHFLHEPFYVRIVPAWLPAPGLLAAISGACEILGGVGILITRTRRIAGLGLIALMVAVFPANIQMAIHPELYRDIGSQPVFVARLPLQAVLIAAVWWACLRLRSRSLPCSCKQ